MADKKDDKNPYGFKDIEDSLKTKYDNLNGFGGGFGGGSFSGGGASGDYDNLNGFSGGFGGGSFGGGGASGDYDNLKGFGGGFGGGSFGGGGANGDYNSKNPDKPSNREYKVLEKLKDFIGKAESQNNYSAMVGMKIDNSILSKNISELEKEKGSQFALGRFQIQMRTAKDVLKKAKINPDTFVFDEKGQDQIFKLILQRKGYDDFISGKIDKKKFGTNLSKEWAALSKNEKNESNYKGVGNNKANRSWDETMEVLEEHKPFTDSERIDAYNNYQKEISQIGETGNSLQQLNEIKKRYSNKYGAENLNLGRELSNYNNKVEWESNNPEYAEAKKAEEEAKKIQRKIDTGEIHKHRAGDARNKINNLNKKRNYLFGKIKQRDLDRIENENLESLKLEDVGTDAYNAKLKVYNKSKSKNENLSQQLKNEDFYNKNYKTGGGGFTNRHREFHNRPFVDTPDFKAEDYYSNNNEDIKFIDYNKNEEDENGKKEGEREREKKGEVNNETKEEVIKEKENKDDILFGTPFQTTQAPSMYSDDTKEEGSAKDFLKNNPLAPLTALTGITSAIDAKKSVNIPSVEDTTKLSDAFYEHLNNLETISKRGFTPEEEANFLKNANDGYNASMQNAVRASGGNRAQVLNQANGLNANRNDSLLDFASNDAEMQRRNLDNYGKALQYKEQFQVQKDVRQQTYDLQHKNLKFQQELQSREGSAMLAASSIGSVLKDVKEYKQVGKGSQFDKFLNLRNKNLENDMMTVNPNTGKFYKNSQEFDNVRNQMEGLNSWENNIKSSNSLTKEQADWYNNFDFKGKTDVSSKVKNYEEFDELYNNRTIQ